MAAIHDKNRGQSNGACADVAIGGPSQENGSWQVLHSAPGGPIEARWRVCLGNCDFPTHYAAPEFFLEPILCRRQPFAVLCMMGEEVAGILTGTNDGDIVRSGISVRPQIAFSCKADRPRVMASLVAGLINEAKGAKLVDLFVWSDMESLVPPRFSCQRYEGVVMLDLSRGPDALLCQFSANKRTNIKKSIKYGVSVAPATSRDEIAAYYAICVDWSHRKGLPIASEEEFHQLFALTDNRLLLLARHQGKIIAGLVIRYVAHGVMEYAANSSLESALHLRPNDLLHWRAIEWGYREGITKYSLGGTHLFLRKFGGEIVPTTRHRLDLSLFRRFAIGDWIIDQADRARPLMSDRLTTLARSLRGVVRQKLT
jgi:Acetyltransferase (GNAT) domain